MGPVVMAEQTSADLVRELEEYHLLEARLLAEVRRKLVGKDVSPRVLANNLLRQGFLTTYQAQEVVQGRGADLLMGDYVLLKQLGEGGMGVVWKARNWQTGKIVALKLIKKERLDSSKSVKRFLREIEAASQLSHPNIVAALDAGSIGDRHFYAMEFVDGTDLARQVKKLGPLPVEQACVYIRQAAEGLQHASERGLVHRDIKPHNLLLTASSGGPGEPVVFRVKILDMGLARIVRPEDDEEQASMLTEAGLLMGTVDYLAPEQAKDARSVDIRADLYSLGCTFYFLLTGKPPFPGGSAPERLERHQKEPAPPVELQRPDVPPAVAAIVHKLLAKQPAERYQTPAELIGALTTALAAARAPAPARASPSIWVRQRWLLAAGALAFVLLTSILSAFALWLYFQPERISTNSIGMRLQRIAPGQFVMGSPPPEAGRSDNETAHPVQITRPFYLGVYPVTQEQYQRVMAVQPSHHAPSGPGAALVANQATAQFPVESVSWEEATEFCRRLSDRPEEKRRRRSYRLPTEAEWEYAARAGTTSAYPWGEQLGSAPPRCPAAEKLGRPAAVGSYRPNPFGLFDTHGNVWQWCGDWYDPAYYPSAPVRDPAGPAAAATRVCRGGAFDASPAQCRSAFRSDGAAAARWPNTGFRVVMLTP